VSGIT